MNGNDNSLENDRLLSFFENDYLSFPRKQQSSFTVSRKFITAGNDGVTSLVLTGFGAFFSFLQLFPLYERVRNPYARLVPRRQIKRQRENSEAERL